MSVSGVSGTSSSSSAQANNTQNDTSKNLSMNDFFTLLAAQLQYQDPMQPTDNSQFMAQMAQFSLLEQMQSLNKTMNLATATSSIGKTAIYSRINASGKQESCTGIITACDISSDVPKYKINDEWIAQSGISSIENASDQP